MIRTISINDAHSMDMLQERRDHSLPPEYWAEPEQDDDPYLWLEGDDGQPIWPDDDAECDRDPEYEDAYEYDEEEIEDEADDDD